MPLSEVEQRTLDVYVATLQGALGERLLLESGRQISPQFRTPGQHAASASRETIDADAIEVWACR